MIALVHVYLWQAMLWSIGSVLGILGYVVALVSLFWRRRP